MQNSLKFSSTVICADGSHYFPNKVALVCELNRTSRDNGYLILLAIRTKALISRAPTISQSMIVR